MVKRPLCATASVALSGISGFCVTDGSCRGGVCPPAPQAARTMMLARKAKRCRFDRFTTVPSALRDTRRACPVLLLQWLQRVREAMDRQSYSCDAPVNIDGFRPLPVSSTADSVSGLNHRSPLPSQVLY